MVNKYQEAIECLKNGENKKAYDIFTELYENDKKDYVALYYRAFASFLYLPDKREQTIVDFEKLIASNSPFKYQSMAYLVLIYADQEKEKAIKYGDEAIKHNPNMYLDLNFALSRAYFACNDTESLQKALVYINNCIAKDEDENGDYYLCKAEILLGLEEYDEVEAMLDKVYTTAGGSFHYYYFTATLKLDKYYRNNDETFLDKALADFMIANQYEENNFNVIQSIAEIYALKGEKEKALKEIENVKSQLDDDLYLVEQFKLYEILGESDTVIKIASDYVKNHDSWRIYYSLGFFLTKTAKTLVELKELKSVYLKAYELNKAVFIFNELYRVNFFLGDDQNNLELLEDIIKDHQTDGHLYYLLGETKQRLNFDYDEVIECFEKSYVLGYCDEFKYLSIIIPLCSDPLKVAKKLKKFQSKNYCPSDIWLIRRIGIMLLYGEDGFSKKPDQALTLLEHCNEMLPDDSCMSTSLGRAYELNNQFIEAFKCYNAAYVQELEELFPVCNCASGYLAHAYLNGIGTTKDEDMAKKLILDGISLLKEKSSNIVIYLYAYFALTGDKRFSLSTALNYLEYKYPFYRYEITRAMMIKIIRKKLNQSTKDNDAFIALCVKYGNKDIKNYYKENKDKDIIYPLFNNY